MFLLEKQSFQTFDFKTWINISKGSVTICINHTLILIFHSIFQWSMEAAGNEASLEDEVFSTLSLFWSSTKSYCENTTKPATLFSFHDPKIEIYVYFIFQFKRYLLYCMNVKFNSTTVGTWSFRDII